MAGREKWEDKPSMEGLAIVQSICGVPYDPSKTKGELMLSYQNRIAEAVEKLASETDPRTIVEVVESDNSEALNGISDHLDRMLEELDRSGDVSDEQLTELRTIAGIQAEMRDGIDDVADEVRVGNAISTAVAGIGIAQLYQTRSIGKDLKEGLDRIDDTLWQIMEYEEEQSEWLESIYDSISELSGTVGEILEEGRGRTRLLAELVKVIKAKMVQDKVAHEDMKKMFFMLFQVVLRRFAGFRQDFRQGVRLIHAGLRRIEKGQDAIIERLDNREKIKAVGLRDNGFLWLAEGKYEEAIVEFEKCLQIDSRDLKGRLGLARAYRKCGNGERYEREFSLAATVAKSQEEKDLLYEELMDKLKFEDPEKIESGYVHLLMLLFPHKFMEIVQFMEEKYLVFDLIEVMRKKNMRNASVILWAAFEYATVGDDENAKELVSSLVSNESYCIPEDSPVQFSVLGSPEFTAILSGAADDIAENLDGSAALAVSSILAAGEGADSDINKYLVSAFENLGMLNLLVSRKKYEEAYDLLAHVFGKNLSVLRRFDVVPRKIRSLIEKKDEN